MTDREIKTAAREYQDRVLDLVGYITEPPGWDEAFLAGAKLMREKLKAEIDDWKLGSKVEAKLGDEARAEVAELQADNAQLREAIYDIWPNANVCEHDYEPNTTMDYFRCEKCGIRPKLAEALERINEK